MKSVKSGLRIGQDIAERLDALAIGVLKMACALPHEPGYRHVAQQLARAGTAGGAHYEEARGAESRADFVHKLLLSLKEVRETLYWLRVARGVDAIPLDRAELAIDEATQLASILAASARTARVNARR
jgi:four helix bundle protein